jgi:hypothetical protein
MMWSYPAKYRDKLGEVTTTIQNDGRTLRMVVRSIEFCGTDFDSLEPTEQDASTLSSFTLQQNCLCSCVIECQLLIPIVGAETAQGSLDVHLELGNPEPRGGLDRKYLQLGLKLGSCHFRSSGKSGWFEDELLEIQNQLREGIHMKACINCAFSDYSPYGHGLFGHLACFRGNKEGYRYVRTKADLFQMWDTMTEYVQETYLCPEFENRRAGTGYRS